MTTKYLSKNEAAKYIGVSPRKFFDLTKQSGFPKAFTLGERSNKWSVTELDTWMESTRNA